MKQILYVVYSFFVLFMLFPLLLSVASQDVGYIIMYLLIISVPLWVLNRLFDTKRPKVDTNYIYPHELPGNDLAAPKSLDTASQADTDSYSELNQDEIMSG